MMFKFARLVFISMVMCVLLTACKTTTRDDANFMPRVGGNPLKVAETPIEELRNLQLISTNLVSALVQIPETRVGTTTLQVSAPTTAFGNTLLRALEDAGYGVQIVSADQGLNYVTYGKRFAETEAGVVNDYGLSVSEIEVRREYDVTERGVFPASLLLVSGTQSIVDIEIDDSIFSEQGGSGDTFISGVGSDSKDAPSTTVSTVTVNDYDAKPLDKRTTQDRVLSAARLRTYAKESEKSSVNLNSYSQLRRTVLIFEDKHSSLMGRGNKHAVRKLAQEFTKGDVIAISACNDVDGKNEASEVRAVRVEEEFVSHGITPSAVHIEPCIRASYRHSSDNSPVAVSVVQYRKL